MGNQLPAKCIVPCNPQCCALCIHGELGKAEEEDIVKDSNVRDQRQRSKGGIFANAAAVLTAGAEDAVVNEQRDQKDLSPNDHLERELANEVELWRMDAASVAVHRMVLTEATDATAKDGTAATAVGMSMPFADARRLSRDRSVSPPLRTQVSLHDRAGAGVADPCSVTARPFAFGSGEENRSCGDDPAGFVCSGSRGATASTACEEPHDTGAEEGAAPTMDDGAGFTTPTAVPAEAVAAGTGSSPPAASQTRGSVSGSPVTLNSMFFEGLPDDAADTREVEAVSSSDESTFAGFIEDPYEQQRAAEVYSWMGESPHSQRATAAYSLASESPAPHLRTTSFLSEDVRPDRSPYF